MYKTELLREVARRGGVSQGVARRVLNHALAAVQESLGAGKPVILPGFGTFYLRTWPGGRVLDFPTGSWKKLGPRPMAAFRAGAVTRRLVGAPRAHGRRRKRWRE